MPRRGFARRPKANFCSYLVPCITMITVGLGLSTLGSAPCIGQTTEVQARESIKEPIPKEKAANPVAAKNVEKEGDKATKEETNKSETTPSTESAVESNKAQQKRVDKVLAKGSSADFAHVCQTLSISVLGIMFLAVNYLPIKRNQIGTESAD